MPAARERGQRAAPAGDVARLRGRVEQGEGAGGDLHHGREGAVVRIVHRAEAAVRRGHHTRGRGRAGQVEQTLSPWPGGRPGEPDQLAPEAPGCVSERNRRPVGERPSAVADEDRREDDGPQRYELERPGHTGGEQHPEQEQTADRDDDQLRGRQAEQHAPPRAVRELDGGRTVGVRSIREHGEAVLGT